MRLEVPCFRQELSYTCVPACLRMVLAYLGEEYVEADLATVCGTSRIGTSEGGVVRALETLGCDYEYLERGDLDTITSWLAEGHPVIVFLRIDHLMVSASG